MANRDLHFSFTFYVCLHKVGGMKKQTIDSFLKKELGGLRKEGWTLSRIAEKVGISQPTLSRYINGELSLRLTSADKLYSFLVHENTTPDETIHNKDHPNLGE